MGRFARSSERGMSGESQTKLSPRPMMPAQSSSTSRKLHFSKVGDYADHHAPSEMKYFVLALAALIGLGIGWLSGKAITQGATSTATLAVAKKAVAATFDG